MTTKREGYVYAGYHIPVHNKTALAELAKRSQRSASAFLSVLIERTVKEAEDNPDWKL